MACAPALSEGSYFSTDETLLSWTWTEPSAYSRARTAEKYLWSWYGCNGCVLGTSNYFIVCSSCSNIAFCQLVTAIRTLARPEDLPSPDTNTKGLSFGPWVNIIIVRWHTYVAQVSLIWRNTFPQAMSHHWGVLLKIICSLLRTS